jgi:hypothetical protein
MSDPRLREAAEAAREATLNAVWRQWRTLGAPLAGGASGPTRSIIDPEALVLLSLVLRKDERRLDDVLGWWAGFGASLLSVQRIATMAGAFPDSVREDLRELAWTAAAAGDRRWGRLKGEGVSEGIVHRGKGHGELRLGEEPALMLKLRAGFGVGVKADVLSILIGLGGSPLTVRTLAAASSYTLVAVRAAAQEMVQAKIIRTTSERPAIYSVDADGWLQLLFPKPNGVREAPPWRFSAQVFAFLAGVLEWADAARDVRVSTYVHSSRARDLFEAHQAVFSYNQIVIPDTQPYRGPEFLTVFQAIVERLSTWTEESL